ncbi:MAG: hypothetical protein Q7V02_07105 [Methylophilus sp.]|nr:hypothetical protein [Methylophilus sp.]
MFCTLGTGKLRHDISILSYFMALLINQLSVWDISFRWFGYDPRKIYLRIPIEVEDLARTLIHAIHKAELGCETVSLEKKEFEEDMKSFSFYYWVDDFFSTASGTYVSRKLLKWAIVSRYDLLDWCKRMNAQPPHFWFPEGWNLEYSIEEGELKPGHGYRIKFWTEEQRNAYFEEFGEDDQDEDLRTNNVKLRKSQEAKVACRQVAGSIWKQDKTRTIASIINDPILQELCGAKYYDVETVRGWINDLAPDEIRNHRGRPKKNKD